MEILRGSELLQALRERDRKPVLATRVAELDRLQGGGLRRGTFVEVSGPRSSGRFAIGLAALAAATQAGEAAALVDAGDHLDPEAARATGVDLRRLLWLRPPAAKLALMSAEMVLGTGFSLVVLDLGSFRMSVPRSPEAAWMRLARATVEHKSIVLAITLEPLRTVAADVLVRTDGAQARWVGEGPSRLLTGLSVHVTVRRRKGVTDQQQGRLHFTRRESVG